VFLSKKVSEENKILGYVSQGAFLSIPSPNPYHAPTATRREKRPRERLC
jgi:hypothetical protein